MSPMIKDKNRTIISDGNTVYSHELRCEVKVIRDESGELAFDHELLSTGKTHRFKITEERAKKMTVTSSGDGNLK